MSKTKPKTAAARTPDTASDKEKVIVPPSEPDHGDGLRETIESVIVAFVLAFLFRTFEAEAFVIPTGSMAPTLMGRHKDLHCEKCGYPYRVSASDEVTPEGAPIMDHGMLRAVDTATCPMCRYTMVLEGPGKQDEYPSYYGDRILVAKFPYELSDPQRWDVMVFKYPQEAATNYIKRLVGLPNETLWIVNGDIYTGPDEDGPFTIARKDSPKLQAMLQVVYDNDYVLPSLLEAGWPARWQPWAVPLAKLGDNWETAVPVVATPAELPKGHWQPSEDHKSFSTNGTASEPVWLRYQHTVPAQEHWNRLENGERVESWVTRIDDFNAYNHFTLRDEPRHRNGQEPSAWVGDLVLDFEAQITGDQGTVTLELIEGEIPFRCEIDVATGKATLTWTGQTSAAPAADTKIKGPGTYHLAFGNVDDQLLLWVDGKQVEFDQPTTYDSMQLGSTRPGNADYAPVGIASSGVPMQVNHLCLLRDLYYTAIKGHPHTGYQDDRNGVKFRLEADQFFVLGDNSRRSADSRMWNAGERYVHRDMLIGKALYIYWPHSWNKVPGTEIPFPFFPNFERMGFVR